MDKVDLNKKTSYQKFRDFDVDGDGYISQNDFITKVERMNVGQKSDVEALAWILDPDNNGYIEYKDFAKKFNSSLIDTLENKSPNNVTILPN